MGERALREDLRLLRSAIAQYTLDKQEAPQALHDLVSAGYLKAIPRDPIGETAEWRVVQDDSLMTVNQRKTGITDVYSFSDAQSSDGSPYSSW